MYIRTPILYSNPLILSHTNMDTPRLHLDLDIYTHSRLDIHRRRNIRSGPLTRPRELYAGNEGCTDNGGKAKEIRK